MASTLKINTLTGVSTAGSIAVTGEGNSTTTNLQQGLAKVWIRASDAAVDADSLNVSSTTDNDTGNLYLKVNGIIFDALCKSIELYVKENPQLNDIAKWRYHPDYNLQKYFPNQAYHSSHCECDNLQHASRVCAWMFYFNTIQDGGGTHFDSYDYTTNAVQGRCVIWPAYWTHFHHGIVSKTETKYIATGWINYVDSV